MGVWAYTDYPMVELGDVADEPARMRRVVVLSWDRDKYCVVAYDGQQATINAGYIYQGMPGYRKMISIRTLQQLPVNPKKGSER